MIEQVNKVAALRELRRIPGVGASIALDLWDLGMRQVGQLDGADPERLYDRLCVLRGTHIDRCMLYVLRCAVYFAGPGPHDPELLKWWAWKDAARDAAQDAARDAAQDAARDAAQDAARDAAQAQRDIGGIVGLGTGIGYGERIRRDP